MIPTTEPFSSFRPERSDRRVDDPVISVDVPLEVGRLRADRAYDTEGHAGRTLTKYPDLRVVLEAMKPNARLRLHATAERMTLQVIVGQLRVWTESGESVELSEGGFAAMDAERVHEIDCIREGAFLLTLAWPPVSSRAEASERYRAYGAGI